MEVEILVVIHIFLLCISLYPLVIQVHFIQLVSTEKYFPQVGMQLPADQRITAFCLVGFNKGKDNVLYLEQVCRGVGNEVIVLSF